MAATLGPLRVSKVLDNCNARILSRGFSLLDLGFLLQQRAFFSATPQLCFRRADRMIEERWRIRKGGVDPTWRSNDD